MKKLFKPVIAALLLIVVLDHPVVAQPTSHETTTSTDMDRHDNTGKWGLLGLVGLVGLLTKKRAEKTGSYTTPQNR